MTLARGAAPRQAPHELTLAFTTEETIRDRARAADEPAWLLDDRLAAHARFIELPIESNQLYTTYVDLRTAHLAEIRPYLAPQEEVVAGAERPALADDASAFIEIHEDALPALTLSSSARRAGVTLETLGTLARRDRALFKKLVEGGLSLPADDRLAQLARAFWTQGVHLHVPDGVRLEQPVVIRWALGRPDHGLVARTFVTLGEDAAASVVEEQVASVPAAGGAQAFYHGTTEVRLDAGAELAFAGLQDFSLDQIAFQNRRAIIGERASLHWALAHLGSRLVKSRIDNRIEGDGAAVEQVEIVFGGGDQVFDLTSYTRHLGRDTTGNLLSKAALADAARAYLKGLITIEKTARGTDSFLGEYGMLLNKKARSVTIPSLEIDQPDCRRVAHSSSVGPIDPAQLFYLESRGIPPDEARKFIVLGYLEPVVARMPLESEQDRLRELLERKWASGRPTSAAA